MKADKYQHLQVQQKHLSIVTLVVAHEKRTYTMSLLKEKHFNPVVTLPEGANLSLILNILGSRGSIFLSSKVQ